MISWIVESAFLCLKGKLKFWREACITGGIWCVVYWPGERRADAICQWSILGSAPNHPFCDFLGGLGCHACCCRSDNSNGSPMSRAPRSEMVPARGHLPDLPEIIPRLNHRSSRWRSRNWRFDRWSIHFKMGLEKYTCLLVFMSDIPQDEWSLNFFFLLL